MKTLYLTLAFLIFAASVNAQKYTMAYNDYSHKERAISNTSSLSNFKKDVISKEKFAYRDFLKQTKNNKNAIQVGQQTFTKKELTKLLRKSALKADNIEEFENLLNKDNPQFTNDFSNTELQLIYQKFREGSLHKYIDDLVSNW